MRASLLGFMLRASIGRSEQNERGRLRALEYKSPTIPYDSLPPGCKWLGVIDGATHMNFAGIGLRVPPRSSLYWKRGLFATACVAADAEAPCRWTE